MPLRPIIKQCIRMCVDNQEKHLFMLSGMPSLQYCRELKTVTLDVGRQTGKTQSIIAMHRPGDYIFVHNREAKNHYPSHVRSFVFTIEQFRDFSCGQRFNESSTSHRYVFVDEGRSVSPQDMDFIYSTLDAEVYILLGTPAMRIGV